MMRLSSLLVLLVILLNQAELQAQQYEFAPGTVIFTRNPLERDNDTPGYWNHLAIVDSTGRNVIEAQEEIVENDQGRGVIRTPLDTFLTERDYTPIAVISFRSAKAGRRVARRAESFVGAPYNRISSLGLALGPNRVNRGMNCTTVFEAAVGPEDRKARRIISPDGAFNMANGRTFSKAVVVKGSVNGRFRGKAL